MNEKNVSSKLRREEFVSGLTGGTKLEIFLINSFLCISVVIGNELKARINLLCCFSTSQHTMITPRILDLILDFITLIVPHIFMVMSISYLAISIVILAAVTTVILDIILTRRRRDRFSRKEGLHDDAIVEMIPLNSLARPLNQSISTFRGALMMVTCVAILAVDFPAFPRRLAKTEHYGTAFMDLGVGTVILAGGIVRGGKSAASASKRFERVPKMKVSCLPAQYFFNNFALCWALGFGRWAVTMAVGYQVHVGEYGEHWNFFNTIAVVYLFSSLLSRIEASFSSFHASNTQKKLNKRKDTCSWIRYLWNESFLLPWHLVLALVMTASHQMALTYLKLGPWVHGERSEIGSRLFPLASSSPLNPHLYFGTLASLLTRNKEGIISSFGYVALHLWGRTLGSCLVWGDTKEEEEKAEEKENWEKETRGKKKEEIRCKVRSKPEGRIQSFFSSSSSPFKRIKPFLVLTTILWLAAELAERRIEPISRRSCNMPYILWVAAQASYNLLFIVLLEFLGDGGIFMPLKSTLLRSFNTSQLWVFLAANLLTGIINLSFETIDVSKRFSRVILVMYMAIVCTIAVVMESSGRRK